MKCVEDDRNLPSLFHVAFISSALPYYWMDGRDHWKMNGRLDWWISHILPEFRKKILLKELSNGLWARHHTGSLLQIIKTWSFYYDIYNWKFTTVSGKLHSTSWGFQEGADALYQWMDNKEMRWMMYECPTCRSLGPTCPVRESVTSL